MDLELAKSVELFVIVSISDLPTVKYLQNIKNMSNAKGNTPELFRIGDTFVTSLETIGGRLFSIHQKILIMHTNTARILC